VTRPAPRVLYYALGGGLGHLTRSIAVLRQVQRRLTPAVLAITNSPHAALYEAEGVPHTRLTQADGAFAGALAGRIRSTICEFEPDVLVVDAFPRGILGELPGVLPELRCPKVAILRRLRHEYVAQYGVVDFVRSHYRRAVLVEGMPGAFADALGDVVIRVPPVLIRDVDELPSRTQAREALGLRDGERAVLGVGSGSPEKVRGLFRLLQKIRARSPVGFALRLATLNDLPSEPWAEFHVRHFPLMELLTGVDLVVGAAGYNLYHETQALGVPAVFVPQERLYDEQLARASGSAVASSPSELERLMQKWGQTPFPAEKVSVPISGASAVVDVLSELLG
jgi:UDP:flavonoid glycosyltransferase YjiC (YdhE family)